MTNNIQKNLSLSKKRNFLSFFVFLSFLFLF